MNERKEATMATEANPALDTSDPRGLASAEATRPGYLLTPAVDIFENPTTITVLADMPGVAAKNLSIDLNEGVLTITGHVDAPEGDSEQDVLTEYRLGTYQRKFTLSESIDQARIQAKLSDGVLRLELPKVEKAKMRKIEVKSA
jgi:HSP20 family molecular chaperone IbpA